jgi:hypothetical protein
VHSNLKEIANQPQQRKLWRLRKFYAGGMGAIPPTDPRILTMTEQQIDLEFAHMLLDIEEREEKDGNGKKYMDESYEAEEAEEERVNQKLYIENDFDEDNLRKSENTNDGEWEDVEIDDFEDDEF